MTESPASREADSAWLRLRRRKVVQWGVAYAAGAWGLLQVLQFLADTYDWPAPVLRLATLAFALGLPIALTLAWYHGDRGDQKISRPEAGVLVALIALVGGTLWWYVSRLDESAWVTQGAEPTIRNFLPADAASIAVLPFVNMSADKDQEYFADGMAEEVLNLLTQLPQLKVIARTSSFSFKGKEVDVATIARKLNVAHVLEGSVRKSGDTVRITAQLIRTSDSSHLWSQTYDRKLTDVFKIQDEIAGAVVAALKVKLLPAQQVTNKYRTANSEAYNQYLLGNQFFNRHTPDDDRRAVSAYRQAVMLDPGFAVAYAKLAHAESQASGYAESSAEVKAGELRALAAVEKAVTLAPDLADGYAVRGFLRSYLARDWAGARADFERALLLDPGNSTSHLFYGTLLQNLGQVPEACAVFSDATALDPLLPDAWEVLGYCYLLAGRFPNAREAIDRALAMNAESMYGNIYLGRLELLQGHPQEALNVFRRQVAEGWRLSGEAMAEHSLGHARESKRALDSMIARYSAQWPFGIAEVYAWRGEKDKAFEWLERAYVQRDAGLVEMKPDPMLVSLRTDPRFAAMLKKIGLPP